MKTKTKSVKTSKETKITFSQLEEELGFDIVNSIFGFRTFEGKQIPLRTEAKYFFASLLFKTFQERDKFLKDLKTYFSMIHNDTPVEWRVVIGKYEDYLATYELDKLREYDDFNNYDLKFEIK